MWIWGIFSYPCPDLTAGRRLTDGHAGDTNIHTVGNRMRNKTQKRVETRRLPGLEGPTGRLMIHLFPLAVYRLGGEKPRQP